VNRHLCLCDEDLCNDGPPPAPPDARPEGSLLQAIFLISALLLLVATLVLLAILIYKRCRKRSSDHKSSLSISSSLVYVSPELTVMNKLKSPSLSSCLSDHYQRHSTSDIRELAIDMEWTENPLYACATAPSAEDVIDDSELESGIGTDRSDGGGNSGGILDSYSAASTWCHDEGGRRR
jgi:hypothetical protein